MLFTWMLDLLYVIIDIDEKSFVILYNQSPFFFSIFWGFILKDALFWLCTRCFASYQHCCLIQGHLTSHNFLLVVALLIFGIMDMICVIIGVSLYSGYFCYAIWIPCMLGLLFFIVCYYNFDPASHVLWKCIVSYLCYSSMLLTFTS